MILARFIATFGFSGLIRPAPGTWGTIAAVPVGWLLITWWGTTGLVIGILAAFFVGWLAAHYYMSRSGSMDDPAEVVIDEAAGLWVAYLAIPAATWPWLLGGFLLFRLFDIWKPGPIRWADRRIKGALGTMIDDIIGGAAAAICLMAVQVVLQEAM